MTSLIISKHWFRLDAVRGQATSWSNVDQVLLKAYGIGGAQWVDSLVLAGVVVILLWQCPIKCNASVTTRRTCYGSCVAVAVAELSLKFCVSCDWLGSESDSAVTVPATHVSCGRHASDAPNRTQKIPQRRHVQRTVPSWYLQGAFAVPPATCPYGGVRVCTSVARRRTSDVRFQYGLGGRQMQI